MAVTLAVRVHAQLNGYIVEPVLASGSACDLAKSPFGGAFV